MNSALKLVRPNEAVRHCRECGAPKPESDFFKAQHPVCKPCWKAKYHQRKDCSECGQPTHAIRGVCPDCKREAKVTAWRAEVATATVEPEAPPDYVPDPETEAFVGAVLRGRPDGLTMEYLILEVEALQRWALQVRICNALLDEMISGAGTLSVRIDSDGEPRFSAVPAESGGERLREMVAV